MDNAMAPMIRTICSAMARTIPGARWLSVRAPTWDKAKLPAKLPAKNKMPPRPKICEDEIEEKFIKGGSGKGGQKINKTNSKVQLRHIETGVVVTSQATRSREQNRKIAREILALKLQELRDPDNARTTVVNLKKQQVKARQTKRTKAKYKRLEQEKEAGTGVDQEELEFIKKMLEQNNS